MKKPFRHPMAALLRQGLLVVIIAAAVGFTVNTLRPDGLAIVGAADPVVPAGAGGDISRDSAEAPKTKDAATASGAGPTIDGGPSVQVPQYRFGFDPVPEGTTVEHAFVVRNRGGQTLSILRVEPG